MARKLDTQPKIYRDPTNKEQNTLDVVLSTISKHQDELKGYVDRIEATRNSITSLETKKQELEKGVTLAEDVSKRKQNELKAKELKIENDLKEAEVKLATFKEVIAKETQEANVTLNKLKGKVKTETESYRNSCEIHNKLFIELSKKNEEKEKENTTLNNKTKVLTSKNLQIEQDININLQKGRRLKTQVNDMRSKLDNLEEAISKAKTKENTIKDDY